jgi:septal ring factor EnvC (AmiA/AmiB activator)
MRKKSKVNLLSWEALSMTQKIIATLVSLSAFLGLAFSLEAHWTPKTVFNEHTITESKKIEEHHEELLAFQARYSIRLVDETIDKLDDRIYKLKDKIDEISKKRGRNTEEIKALNDELHNLQVQKEAAQRERDGMYKKAITDK